MISIIIPSYNHAKYLERRMETVFNQEFQDFEIIILDDHSTDESGKIIESYRSHPKVVHIEYNEQNSGSTFKQWAKGLSHAKGEWIWIAESDDYCDYDFLSVLLSENIPDEYGLRYCISKPVDANDNIFFANEKLQSTIESKTNGILFLEKYLLQKNQIPNASSVIVKKDLLIKSIDTKVQTLKLVGDWIVWCRICLETGVFFSQKTKNYHRSHQESVRTKAFEKGEYYLEFNTFRRIMSDDIKSKNIERETELLDLNQTFMFYETGMRGLELVQKKKYFNAIPLIITASLKPRLTPYFIKSIFYRLLKNE